MPDDITTGSSPATNTGSGESGASVESTPASAIETREGSDSSTGAQPQGPIPFDRHKQILDGAYHERDTFKQQLEEARQRYSWAEQVDPAEFQQIQRWSSAYRDDPVRWMAETMAELRQTYPHLTPALTSEAARILAGSRGFQPAEAEPEIEPDIPVLDANGQVVSQAFSADRVRALIQRAVTEALTPVKQSMAQREAREQVQRQTTEALQSADALFEKAQQWHGFQDHRPSILRAMQQHGDWSLHDAYLHVLHTEILPNADQRSQTKLLTQLQTQAAGATVHPGVATSSAKPKFTNFREAAMYYEKHPEEAAAMAER